MRTCRSLISCAPLIISLAASLYGQVPSIGDPPTAPQLRPSLLKGVARNVLGPAPLASTGWYDTSTRTAVRDTWNLTFWPTITVPTGWTGNVDSNIPGTTTQAFKDAVAARINWFRAMAGVPAQIAISPVYSAKAQQAALMFSANRQISHYPPSTWVDYSAEGAEAAANSNICYGYFNDPGCVAAYIADWGASNAAAGHRRWILYPQTLTMGTGDVPQSGPVASPYPPANALWVFDGMFGTARPATRAAYVAWPPPGFVPYQVVPQRWSFSYPAADFSGASVSMQRNGAAVPVRLEPVLNGYGENTIVWVPDNLDASSYYQPPAPAADTTSSITLTNVLIGGVPQTFSYSVTVFDPDTAPGSSFEFQPTSASIGSGGSSGATSFVVTPASTTWTAASSANWLSLNSAVSGTGSTSISWSAPATSSSYQRTATIRGGTATFTVVQDGAPCSYAFSGYSGTLLAAGGSGSFTITSTPSDCPFGSYSWSGPITVASSWAGTGVLTVTYSAGANSTGSARLSTIQVAGSSFSVTQSVGFQASLTITKTHSGNFTQGQNGATYSVTVSNATGAGPTSGTVTVTETVPSGLTLVSMSGTGWSCSTNTCTRSDVLSPDGSYPAITVTVNVAANASSPQVNAASVSGGGSASANTTDSTVINTLQPFKIGTYHTGLWQLDVNGNGTFDSGTDRNFFLGWAGATMVTGDWNGDGRTKAGVYSNGYWFLDYDGNGVWDGGVNDKLVAWGWAGATPIVGDWNGDGKTKIGVYSNGFWFLDYNGDFLWDGGVVDKQVGWGWAGVTPIVGDWNGDGKTKIGVYVNGFWFLDYDGNYLWDGGVVDKQVGWGWAGVTPIVGDWNGDGKTKIGVYSGGYWYVDYDGNYLWEYPAHNKIWALGWAGTTPVIGDWNGDGKSKAGAFINGYWYLDYNGNGVFDGAGTDRIFAFGAPGDTPVVGRW